MKAKSIFLGVAAICGATFEMDACTGISLTAKDGSFIMARTIEWAKTRMNNKMVIIPIGKEFMCRESPFYCRGTEYSRVILWIILFP